MKTMRIFLFVLMSGLVTASLWAGGPFPGPTDYSPFPQPSTEPDSETLKADMIQPPLGSDAVIKSGPVAGVSVQIRRYPRVPQRVNVIVPPAGKIVCVTPIYSVLAWLNDYWNGLWYGQATFTVLTNPHNGMTITQTTQGPNAACYELDMSAATKNTDSAVIAVSYANRPYPRSLVVISARKGS